MFEQLFNEFKTKHVAVVGDVMLDTYWWGQTERISPEAPVPVVTLREKESRIGGAGNVALNLASLGANVSMHTVTGADEDGLLLELMMKDRGINVEGVWKSPNRMTTNKIRIISRSQHMLRLDREIVNDLNEDESERFYKKTITLFNMHKPDVVIFEDYNKGLLTQKVISKLIEWCRENGVITAVDPKRKNFFEYKGVDIFKPNWKEAREALNFIDSRANLENLKAIHELLIQKLDHKISFITLSEAGVFYQNDKKAVILPAFIRNIADVSGAGDTVIAVAALVYACTGDPELMALVANLAGGLVCEEVGTVAIDANRLLNECLHLLTDEEGMAGIIDG
ncbi:MAG: PfkB family carbohydrate kinase [Chitinophagaceae bacterium]|nr:PfkB family carbohydrate kinase [Chitinophagaceae bacterium]